MLGTKDYKTIIFSLSNNNSSSSSNRNNITIKYLYSSKLNQLTWKFKITIPR